MSWEIDNRVANSIALFASFLSVVMWLAPIRDIWTADYSIYHLKSTENVATGFGFVAGTFNCVLWLMYASTHLDTMMVPIVVNSAGFVLNVSFVLCYWYYGGRVERNKTCLQLLFMMILTVVSAIIWIVKKDNEPVG